MPLIVLEVPSPLRRAAGGTREVAAEGETVAEALASLRGSRPALARLILQDSHAPRPGVSLFLNGTQLEAAGRLEATLAPGDRLAVLLPIAGG